MRKQVGSREFFRNFSRVYAALKPGETLLITKNGKALGEFRKLSPPRAARLPDFEDLPFQPKASLPEREQLFQKLMRSIEPDGLY